MEQSGPSQFGPYIVLEQIGSGGMGAVFRARDSRLQRDVAVKALHRHLAGSPARERFLREARAVSSLNHPNICTIFDIGEEFGDPYLVMELLEGESLRERLAAGPISQLELEAIAMQCALALSAAHAKGIVHRDIKPANLFLVANPAGEVCLKVLDFGLAKMENDRLLYGESGLTRTGSTVGTVEYMSPEQARGEHLDPRSDLFSLGAVLYELATGDVPFRGATSAVVFAALLGSTPPPPRATNASVPPGMDAIIRKLLEKRVYARTQSANDLILALRALQSSPLSVPVAVPEPAAADPSAAPQMRDPVSRGDFPEKRALDRRTSSRRRAAADMGEIPEETTEAIELPRRKHFRLAIIIALAVLLIAAVDYVMYRRATPAALRNVLGGALQVTAFTNSTGDAAVGDAPAVALQLLLQTMPGVSVPGYAPPATGAEPDAKALALGTGAPDYLTGEVSRSGQGYRVHAAIVRAADGVTLASEDSDAGSLVEIPQALSRVALALRTHMGESPDQANANAISLNADGSSSLPALNFYARGLALRRAGQQVAAAAAFDSALAQDANFGMARWQLAEALRAAGAEPERVASAAPLRALADTGSACERDAFAYELADDAGALQAAQGWATACPKQSEAQTALSREYLAQGRGFEAESAATLAVTLDPGSRCAQTALTLAALSQGHNELALNQQRRAAELGVSSPGLLVLAAYLRGDTGSEAQAAADATRANGWDDVWNYVTYLTNRGRVQEALNAGDAAASRLEGEKAVASSASLMRARLDAIRAMTGHCGGLAFAGTSSGRSAYFAALAAAWCHRPAVDLSGVKDSALLALARGAQAWSAGDADGALTALGNTRPGADATVAALLRGEIHLMQKQEEVAIGDYRAVLTHRGSALLTGTAAYPAANAGLAAAYRSMGDEPNSASAQSDLQALWSNAAKNEPLLHRAGR